MPTILSKLYDILDYITNGTTTAAFLAGITHVAFFSNYGTNGLPGNTDLIADKYELGRVTPFSIARVNELVTIKYTVPQGTILCPSSTVVSNTSDTIELADASSFNSSDELIQIDFTSPRPEQRGIIGKVGDTITINEVINQNPAIGTKVKVMCNQIALILNGTGVANSGELLHIEQFTKYIDASTAIFSGNITFSLFGK